ncbi:MAG: type I DNA topoisomerase [Deltaproteobacteria bacterium]|nr:type I DNA topoisomerase [Deltaproteobacteria bacterium]
MKDSQEKTLMVVESPAKAKTIKKYLGPNFEVKASVGHVKDLPQTAQKTKDQSNGGKKWQGPVLGVDVDHGFKPHYEIIPGKEKVISELRSLAKKSSKVFLATDPDREGEAIAWHLSEELGKPASSVFRVRFNELTEKTIKEAVANPSKLDENRYNAQQARRILDRIVGYQISPLLWDKVQYGLSAGRVQSVALRLIVDRRLEIETFVPTEYWTLSANLSKSGSPSFEAKLVEIGGVKSEIGNINTASEVTRYAKSQTFKVKDVKRKERARKSLPPFITSTLQQEASRKLRMAPSRTMRIAQQLYEGVEIGKEGSIGLITYMRTDSPRIAPEAMTAARDFLYRNFGPEYVPPEPNFYKSKKGAQDAHEAIRPTSLDFPPERVAAFLDKQQKDLYTLIWNRFLASQAAPAIFYMTTANITAGDLLFRVTGSIMKFDGFTRIYAISSEEDNGAFGEDKDNSGAILPNLDEGDLLQLASLMPRQRFTQPPPAFNEASLIKELEERGIGRPSTYAEIVTTIQKRKYVEIVDKRFEPTVLGRIIASLLVDSFPDLVSPQFTAEMESSLDLIEDGAETMTQILEQFYAPFNSAFIQARKNMANIKREGVATKEFCPECGNRLLIRAGRYGLFLGCPSYPECSYTKKLVSESSVESAPVPTDKVCSCGAPMVMRQGRSGPFLACSRYPECKSASPVSTGVQCPKCGEGALIYKRTKRGRAFYGCDKYPKCDFSTWNKPIPAKCPNPDCDSNLMEEKISKKDGHYLQCPKCQSKSNLSA